MAEYDFKPNSHKYKQDQKTEHTKKKVEKVVEGKAKTKKKSGIHKFTDIFIHEDATSVKDYIIEDVVIPTAKDCIEDMFTKGIRMLLRGETGARKGNGSYVSYSSYSRDRDRRDNNRPRRSSRYDFDDVIVPSRGDAEHILECMDEIIDEYGMVTVADMYDLAGLSSEYTDNNYGWSNLRAASVTRANGGGYTIKLPKVSPIR